MIVIDASVIVDLLLQGDGADALDCPVWTRDRRFAAAPVAAGRVLVV